MAENMADNVEPMDDAKLLSLIDAKLANAINRPGDELSDVRAKLLQRFHGDLYGNERDGYSKFTTREVFEFVQWMLPDIMEVFEGGENTVSFEPTSEEDVKAAKMETDVVRHRIAHANGDNEFVAVYSFCFDALLNPTAYCKVYPSTENMEMYRRKQGLTSEQLAVLMDEPDVKIDSYEEREVEIILEDGTTAMVPAFDVRYQKKRMRTLLRIEPTPGGEIMVDEHCRTLDLDKAMFVAHRVVKTRTELVNMGYDLSNVTTGPVNENEDDDSERYERLRYEDERSTMDDSSESRDESLRRYLCHECYLWADVDGTGVAQYWKVMVVNHTIVEKERTDYQPFVAMSSIIMPHRHVGMSGAQAVVHMQTLATELTRQLLDNIRFVNTRRKIISIDSLAPDGKTVDSLTDTTAEWIMVEGSAQEAVRAEPQNSIVQELLPVLAAVDQKTAVRSGMTPDTETDAAALQNTTATNYMAAMGKAGRRTGLIAKCFAETGIKKIFEKVRKLSLDYLDVQESLQINGEWVDVDVSTWSEERDIRVQVGMGYLTKQQRFQVAMGVLEVQKEAKGMNLATWENLYRTLTKLIEASGLGSPELFFNDPSASGWQEPQPPPDPATIVAETEAQVRPMEAQTKAAEVQRKTMETKAKIQETMQKLTQEERKLAEDLTRSVLQREGIQADTELTEAKEDLVLAQIVETLAQAKALGREPSESSEPKA